MAGFYTQLFRQSTGYAFDFKFLTVIQGHAYLKSSVHSFMAFRLKYVRDNFAHLLERLFKVKRAKSKDQKKQGKHIKRGH